MCGEPPAAAAQRVQLPDDSDLDDQSSDGEAQEEGNRAANKTFPLAHRCLSMEEFRGTEIFDRACLTVHVRSPCLCSPRLGAGARDSTSDWRGLQSRYSQPQHTPRPHPYPLAYHAPFTAPASSFHFLSTSVFQRAMACPMGSSGGVRSCQEAHVSS
jgi:hypothetical protein